MAVVVFGGLPVGGQVRLGEELSQQHAVRHVLEDRALGRAVLEPDAVAHLHEVTHGTEEVTQSQQEVTHTG